MFNAAVWICSEDFDLCVPASVPIINCLAAHKYYLSIYERSVCIRGLYHLIPTRLSAQVYLD